MNRSNTETLPPHLEVRFLHAQMILELVMHMAYGDLDLNPNSLAMFGLRHIFLRYSRYRSDCERSSEMLAVVIVNLQTASEVSKTKWLPCCIRRSGSLFQGSIFGRGENDHKRSLFLKRGDFGCPGGYLRLSPVKHNATYVFWFKQSNNNLAIKSELVNLPNIWIGRQYLMWRYCWLQLVNICTIFVLSRNSHSKSAIHFLCHKCRFEGNKRRFYDDEDLPQHLRPAKLREEMSLIGPEIPFGLLDKSHVRALSVHWSVNSSRM
jgi:hypothetical protein